MTRRHIYNIPQLEEALEAQQALEAAQHALRMQYEEDPHVADFIARKGHAIYQHNPGLQARRAPRAVFCLWFHPAARPLVRLFDAGPLGGTSLVGFGEARAA